MSTYEDYLTASNYYDMARQPFGLEELKKTLYFHFRGNLSQVHMLDAACGTGNHSAGLLADPDLNIGKITMLDANEGMLSKAKVKVEEYVAQGRVDKIVHHKLPEVPFEENTFDVVMCNFAVHHLERPDTHGFDGLEAVLKNFDRVLRPGGLLIFSGDTVEQLRAQWFHHEDLLDISPTARNQCAPNAQKLRIAEAAGFRNCKIVVPVNEMTMSPQTYFNFEGAFQEEWRKTTSGFSMATPKKVEEMQLKLRKLMSDDVAWTKFKEEMERRRLTYGHGYIFYGVSGKLVN